MFLEPAVNVPNVANAVDVAPLILSPAVNSFPFVMIKVIGFVVLIILAAHPLDTPVIVSPFVNVPDTPVTVNLGNSGLVLASS